MYYVVFLLLDHYYHKLSDFSSFYNDCLFVNHGLGCPQTCYVDQANLNSEACLFLPPASHPAFSAGIKKKCTITMFFKCMGVLPAYKSAHPRVYGANGDQKRVLNSLELKLQMVVNHHVSTGIKLWSSTRAASTELSLQEL